MTSDRAGTALPAYLAELPTWLLGQAGVRSHRMLQQALERLDARGHHARLLATLGEFGPLAQADLGRSCLLDAADVVRALEELERRGDVVRRPDPEDGRRKRVSITPAGRRRLSRLRTELDRVQADVLAPLTHAERDRLVTLLRKIQPGID